MILNPSPEVSFSAGSCLMAVCPHCETRSDTPLAACPSGDGFYLVEDAVYASDSDDRMLGRCIAGRFIISSILGRGAMGTVYRARQEQVDRDVAIKIFRTETLLQKKPGRSSSLQEREAAQARFVQEARVLGKLSHPNCVTVYDFGMGADDKFMYMAMEFVAGVSLHKAIHRGLKFDAIVEITRQILSALREAHTLGIVHRDLKPENIILSYRFNTGEQIVKVLDFGIAKLLQSGGKPLTRAGALFGTPAYMSPEQCRGELGSIGPQVDIYALGCILYEMLCGQLPYITHIPQQMVRLHQEAPIPALNLRRGIEIPSGLEEFIHTCLAKDRHERFADANAAIVAFEKVMEGYGDPESRPLVLAASESGSRTRPCIIRGARAVVLPQNQLGGDVLDPVGKSSAPQIQPSTVSQPSPDAAASTLDKAASESSSGGSSGSPIILPSNEGARATARGKHNRAKHNNGGSIEVLDSHRLRARLLLAVLSLAVCAALLITILYFWG